MNFTVFFSLLALLLIFICLRAALRMIYISYNSGFDQGVADANSNRSYSNSSRMPFESMGYKAGYYSGDNK